jgi:hypothetical protein
VCDCLLRRFLLHSMPEVDTGNLCLRNTTGTARQLHYKFQVLFMFHLHCPGREDRYITGFDYSSNTTSRLVLRPDLFTFLLGIDTCECSALHIPCGNSLEYITESKPTSPIPKIGMARTPNISFGGVRAPAIIYTIIISISRLHK